MYRTYAELLEAALNADKSPEFDTPPVRRKAPGPKALGYDANRVMRCSCTGCHGRTWKRFRATQYRVA